MTNLEIIFIYGAVGLMITLIINEIEHSYIEAEDVIRGVTCWLPFSIALIVLTVYKTIRKIIRD